MYSCLLILVMALVTAAIRFAPFFLFRKKTPGSVLYLGKTLPYCAMAMLVVYCLKGVSFASLRSFLPEAVASVAVIAVYKTKRSAALSILTGTLLYMFRIQKIFR